MTPFQSRPAAVHVLPLPERVTILNVDQVILDFPPKGTLDLGALCYLRRDAGGPRRNRVEGKRVDLSSLDGERVDKVRTVIQFIADRSRYSGLSATTLYAETRLGIIMFTDWADRSGHPRAFYDEGSARAAFSAYVDMLWDQYRRKAIRSSTAARMCKYTLDFLSELLGVEDLHRGLNLPKKKKADEQPTLPPADNVQARAIGLCQAIFTGLSTLVLDHKPFPHSVKMPSFLGWTPSAMWAFPLMEWFRTPDEIASLSTQEDCLVGYNFADGRVSSVDELLMVYSVRRNAVQCRRRAVVTLEAANADPRATMRIALAMQAHHSFTILFLANTGMNLAQLLELEWDDDYKVSTVRQKFKVVKWRAKGKVQSFEIESVFFPDFKRFLGIRKYILGERPCQWLFFSLGVGHKDVPQQMRYFTPRQMYQRLRRMDPTLPNVTSRQWRAADVDWMLRRNVPLAVAADVVQNTERTIQAAYMAGSPETHKSEMTAFFDKVSAVVLNEAEPVEGGQDGPVGLCVGYGKPSAAAGTPKAPDCRNPEGCFFCDKYKVHADEHDTRKLISCRYCILKTTALAASVEHFDQVFGRVLARIDQLLAEIAQRTTDPELVRRIEESVEQMGELDDYWATKLELLMKLDLVTV